MTMHPPQISQLKWLRPRNMTVDEFTRLRPDLERALGDRRAMEVYKVNTRSIYQLDDKALGPIAIKELRFETPYKRWRAGNLRRHRVLCEFNAGSCFAGRGGATPRFLGAALEYRSPGLNRVFFVLEWLGDAVTLTQAMRDWPAEVRERNLVSLAHALVESAEHGLVHGRHSSENILVGDPLRYHIIDFSHSQVFDRFHPKGFMRDVGRIGARLISEDACTQDTVVRFFDEVAHALPTGLVSADRMAAECEKVLTNSKRHQRLERNWHTFWRGLRWRLRD